MNGAYLLCGYDCGFFNRLNIGGLSFLLTQLNALHFIDTHAFTGVVLVGTNFVCPDGNMLSSPPSQVGSSRYIKIGE